MDWTQADGALRRTASLIAAGSPLEIVLDAIVRAVESEDLTIKCSIMLLDDTRERLLMGAAPGLPPYYAAAIEGLVIGPDAGACGTAAYINDRVIVADIRTDTLFAGYRDLAAAAGLGSCWSQPVRSPDGRVIGVFAIYHRDVAVPAEADIALIEAAGDMAAIAIGRQLTLDVVASSAACAQEAALSEVGLARDVTAFFDASLDIMCVHSREGIVHRIGHSVADILGYSPEEMVGQPLLRLVHPDDLETSLLERGGAKQSGLVIGLICRMRHADGRYRYIDWYSRPHGDLVFAVGRDVTDRMARAVEMKEGKQAADAASHAKSVFLTTMSHEIRTPLNGILGMAQIMEGDVLSEAQRGRLDVVRRSGQALLSIVDDILDLAKIEAGRVELASEPFLLDRLIRNKVAAYAPLAAAKGLELLVSVAPGAKRHFIGDVDRIRRILITLLSNAVKFTQAGHIQLEVEGNADGLVTIRVRDTGIGITPEYQARMFEAFQQAESSLTRGYAGAGLGLAICHQSVTLMGGSLSVDSRAGEGTVFVVELPLSLADADALAAGHSSGISQADNLAGIPHDQGTGPGQSIPDEAASPLRVLVAEDHQVNRLVIRALLEQLGIDAIIVEDGVQAVAAWTREAWDVILMDIQMPEMDGLSATLHIREQERERCLPRTPIVAVTANAMPHQIEAYRAAGMDGVVAKPIELAVLSQALEAALAGGLDEPLATVRTNAETILAMFASSQG